ncbi:MAG: gamma-glutamyltransferase, partial [Pseudomonadota bacterium]
FNRVGPALRRLGHQVSADNGDGMGGYQAIWYAPSDLTPHTKSSPATVVPGVYHGASDHRKDGQAVGW